jgi:hypothetical protein
VLKPAFHALWEKVSCEIIVSKVCTDKELHFGNYRPEIIAEADVCYLKIKKINVYCSQSALFIRDLKYYDSLEVIVG